MAEPIEASGLDELRAKLRADGKTEEEIAQAERALPVLIEIAFDVARRFAAEASAAHVQRLWERSAEAGVPPVRAWRLRRRQQFAVCTVEHGPCGRLVRCVVAGVETHVDDVDTLDQMRRTLTTRFVALHDDGWKRRFFPRAWVRILMRRKLAAYRASTGSPRSPTKDTRARRRGRTSRTAP